MYAIFAFFLDFVGDLLLIFDATIDDHGDDDDDDSRAHSDCVYPSQICLVHLCTFYDQKLSSRLTTGFETKIDCPELSLR